MICIKSASGQPAHPPTSPSARPSLGLVAFWRGAALGLVLAAGTAAVAQAHVKWFTVTNVHDTPRPLSAVLSTAFLLILCVAALLVFFGFLLDGWIARRWPRHLSSGISRAAVEERLMRVAAGAYFLCIADTGGTILTPELKSDAPWLGIVQFAIAFALVWRPTCILAAFGIVVLYADAIARYGLFHLTDYAFVPCLALYFASLSLPSSRLRRLREPLLVGGLAFSLAWTAIEKLLYPQWTMAVIATHPSIALGLPPPLVTVIAGFVEFTLAFYLVTGRGLLRLGGAAYALIFIAAMPPFGKLDVFGHLVIIAILCIAVLRGTTPMQTSLHRDGRTLAADSAWIVFLYLSSLAAFFAMYYAMQRS